MSAVLQCQMRRVWKWTAAILLTLWGLIALFTYTAVSQYGKENCWFSVFRMMQALLPVAAVLPLTVWMEPFLSGGSAEVLHALPEIKRAAGKATAMFMLALWLSTAMLPIGCLRVVSPSYPFAATLVRFSVQCLFSQSAFLLAAVGLRSALHGLSAVFLLNGSMLLALEIPATGGTLLRKMNLFEQYAFSAMPPLSLPKTLLLSALSIAFLTLAIRRFCHFFRA